MVWLSKVCCGKVSLGKISIVLCYRVWSCVSGCAVLRKDRSCRGQVWRLNVVTWVTWQEVAPVPPNLNISWETEKRSPTRLPRDLKDPAFHSRHKKRTKTLAISVFFLGRFLLYTLKEIQEFLNHHLTPNRSIYRTQQRFSHGRMGSVASDSQTIRRNSEIYGYG